MRKGKFDLDDLSEQLAQVEKIGGLGGIMGMLPGMAKIKDQMAAAHLDDRIIKRQRAIISSMTREERRNPDILKASRKKRIAAGSGVKVEDVNRLLKQHRQMADMMKSMGGDKRGGALAKMGQALGLPAAAWACRQPTPEQIAALQKQLGDAGRRACAKAGRGASGSAAGLAPKLPGLAGRPGRAAARQTAGARRRRFERANPFGKKK